MRWYVDASAAGKLLVEEAESAITARFLDDLAERGDTLVACLVLETELRRLAVRYGLGQGTVSDLLRRFHLLLPDRTIYRDAGLLAAGGHLRSLDAIHVASALRLDVSAMVTFDSRQAEVARAVGLDVAAPA
jgi:uncharacterized protein